VDYSGKDWSSFTDVPQEQKKWFDSTIMNIAFSEAEVKDVGTYKATVTITSDDDVFAGEATKEGESDKIRIFDFKINPKEIGVDISDVLVVTAKSGAICSDDVGTNREPTFGVTYSGRDGTSYTTPDVYPTAVGKYRATAKILTNGKNYVLDDTYTKDFQIDKREIDKPYLSYDTVTYNGNTQEFEVSGLSTDVEIIPQTSGLSYSNGKLSAKVYVDGGYIALAKLKDTTNTQWKGGGADPIELPIAINKASLNVTFTSSGGWSWNSGIDKVVSITDNRQSDNDKLTFNVSYDGNHIDASKVVQDSANKKQTNITIPKISTAGSYSLSVALDVTGDGKNYTFTIAQQPFTITDKVITVEDSNISWSYSNNGNETAVTTWNTTGGISCEMTYNGIDYTFTATVSGITEGTVVVDRYDTRSGKDVDTYTTTVHLTSNDGSLTKSSFSISWKINQGIYDLSNIEWDYVEGVLRYTGNSHTVRLKADTLPTGLSVDDDYYDGNKEKNVNEVGYTATIVMFTNADTKNYITPDKDNPNSYKYKEGEQFPWTLTWKILKGSLVLDWANEVKTDKSGKTYNLPQISGSNLSYIDGYKYYKDSAGKKGEEIDIKDIAVVEEKAVFYWVEAILKSSAENNYELDAQTKEKRFKVGSNNEEVLVELSKSEYTYDGNTHGVELSVRGGNFDLSKLTITYYKDSVEEENRLASAPTDSGDYVITLEMSEEDLEDYYLASEQIKFSIVKKKITAQWDTHGKTPVLDGLSDSDKQVIEYEYVDENGNVVEASQLEAGKSYNVQAHIKSEYTNNYEFVGEDGEVLAEPTKTGEESFVMKDYDPGDPNDPKNPNSPNYNPNGSDGNGSGGVGLGNIEEFLQKYWQPIVTLISIILTIIFTSKGIGYANKRKRLKKTIEKKYSSYYAVAGTGLFGLTYTNWTVVACIAMGLAVLALAFMIIEKHMLVKVEEELDDARDEYERNKADVEERKRDENMRMMLMGIMGGNSGGNGNGQGPYVVQQGLGADEIRGIVSETMTALLPGMQQLLPQQASSNDEVIQRLVENQEILMRKMSEQPVERVVEREVAASTATDDTIKRILDNQDKLMQKILELSANQTSEPQIIEKEVPVEKIVEKIVEVPVEVEKIVEKEVKVEVPVEVEKIVEKEVVKEVKVEVPVAAPAPSKPKKEVAPRLTLDEAYALLSKQQQKYFDGLRQYALSKPNTKEKKAIYAITIGQSTVNPLLKLTIKKDTTVALFKMEDEYLKDIKRDATSDGTKVKVKETEVIIADAQACKVAKNMIDLREDQIERYQDLLKEQRALSKQRK
ncbi:MAG: hypothetical protein K2I23_00015, partial [Clostridia bacterium]|nr:hypothetical protein [Clostridia bacterium]